MNIKYTNRRMGTRRAAPFDWRLRFRPSGAVVALHSEYLCGQRLSGFRWTSADYLGTELDEALEIAASLL